jgi:hypothetical protein
MAFAAAVLVASCPVTIMYARSFLFALPATSVTTLALFALLRSDRFREPIWAFAFGVFCGLMALTRTMTVAFIPGLVVGALVSVVAERADLGRRALILAGALVLGLATAAPWYWPNGRYVFDYLLNFGYGTHAVEYGRAAPLLNIDAWLDTARYVVGCMYLPHATILLAGAASLLWLAGRRVARLGWTRAQNSFVASNIAPLVIYVAEATAALASSRNKGTGFFAPVVPAAIVLASFACIRVSGAQWWHRALAAATLLVFLLGVVPALDLRLIVARPWHIEVPVLGHVTVTDGRSYIQIYESYGGFANGDVMQPISEAAGRAWVAFSAQTATTLLHRGAQRTTTAFGFIHLLYNLNTVRLAELLGGNPASSLTQVDPLETGDTLAGDLAWLGSGAAAEACLLVTFGGTTGLVFPSSDSQRLVSAAQQVGFVIVEQWQTPDGQAATLWQRTSPERCRDFDP